MLESGYYPPGAEFDPNAPYNQEDIPMEEFDVLISQTLSKNTSIITDDYVPIVEEEIGHLYLETADTNWENAFSENDHYDALQLIELFKRFLEDEVHNTQSISHATAYLQHLINECDGWTEDERELIKN